MKLLLHSCCAPCSIECVQKLKEEGVEPDLFWYNPNIHPYTEYRSRRDSLYSFAAEENLNLVMDDEYGLGRFISGMPKTENPGAGNGGPRCVYCYRLRLEKTAQQAVETGCDAFSTTLLVSPYQNHEAIKKSGEDFASQYGIKFFYRDFRPHFREGQKKAKERSYYMQKYCGCIFSEEERYLSKHQDLTPAKHSPQ